MKEIKRLKRFDSKRNKVYLCSRFKDRENGYNLVEKVFGSKQDYQIEKEIYQFCKDKSLYLCPNLYDYNDEKGILYFEYIDGATIIERLEVYENKEDVKGAVELLELTLNWLLKFYQQFKIYNRSMVLNDINLRNFMVSNGCIYGIDFECCGTGNERYELVKLVAMYLYYKPENTPFKKGVVDSLYSEFYRQHSYTEKEFTKILELEIENIISRRRRYDRLND